jgi:1-acyl-sn-glycerol-3-phosphate acyltransferase
MVFVLAASGALLGLLLVSLQQNRTRVRGLAPYGATGLFFALLTAALQQAVPWWLCPLIGLASGLAYASLLVRPCGAAGYAGALLFAVLTAWLASISNLWLLVVAAGVGAAAAGGLLLRDTYEQTLEALFWPIFRTHGHGPGLGRVPTSGPLLVLANHTAWFDPLWLGKVLPRRLTGMLTSAFFDKPILHFLATRIVHAIRVAESSYRRQAPELDQAIAALDRGEAVLIFPEGQMRKRAEKPLHPFGRGVWQILRERPHVPVVVCWIEGGWGSFTSYHGGPPAKHKKFDFWRRIDVAVCEPEVLSAELLEDHRATRNYLKQKCLNARRHLGLEPLQEQHLAPAQANGN